jgi:hypothetical protein
MNIANILKLNVEETPVIIISVQKSGFVDSDEKPYYECKLKDKVLVTCSMDPKLDTFKTDTVYVRERDLNSEGWILVNAEKPEEGFYRKDWVVDFSQGQEIPIYQAESIRKWTKGQRSSRKDDRRDRLNQKIRESIKSGS